MKLYKDIYESSIKVQRNVYLKGIQIKYTIGIENRLSTLKNMSNSIGFRKYTDI